MQTFFYQLTRVIDVPLPVAGRSDLAVPSVVNTEKITIEYGYESSSVTIVSAWREPDGQPVEFGDQEREKLEARITENCYHEDHRWGDRDDC